MRRVLYRPNSTVLSCRLNAPNCISSRIPEVGSYTGVQS